MVRSIVIYYLPLYVAIAAISMFKPCSWFLDLPIVAGIGYLFITKQFKLYTFDILIFAYMLYCLISFVFSSYPFEVFLNTARWSLLPIGFYFFARFIGYVRGYSFYESLKKPLLVAIAVGFLLYLTMPSFYYNFKLSAVSNTGFDLDSLSDYYIQEMMRFSSFWSHSYAISSLCLYMLIYLLTKIVRNMANIKEMVFVLLCYFVIFFAQQRVNIAYSAIILIIFSVYSLIVNRGKYYLGIIWLFIFFSIILVLMFLNFFNPDFVDYVLERTINSESGGKGMIVERVEMFSEFIEKFSLIGDGFGKYGLAAYGYSPYVCSDCDYIRIIAEIGYLGFSILVLILLSAIVLGFCNFKLLACETSIVLFFPFLMVGAAAFENVYFCLPVFWYSLGRIYYYTSVNLQKKEVNNG